MEKRAAVAQLVEHVIRNDGVGGSSPFSGTTLLNESNDIDPITREFRVIARAIWRLACPLLGLTCPLSSHAGRQQS